VNCIYFYEKHRKGTGDLHYFGRSRRCWRQDRKIRLKTKEMVHTLIHLGISHKTNDGESMCAETCIRTVKGAY
jgi:hypothetical protein